MIPCIMPQYFLLYASALFQKFCPPFVRITRTSALTPTASRTAISGALTAATDPVTASRILGRGRVDVDLLPAPFSVALMVDFGTCVHFVCFRLPSHFAYRTNAKRDARRAFERVLVQYRTVYYRYVPGRCPKRHLIGVQPFQLRNCGHRLNLHNK
jgi:hypothetical protein